MSKSTGVLQLNKPLFGTDPLIGADLDKLDAAITTPRTVTNYAANGAIAQKEGTVTISKGSAAAMTLADPASGAQAGAVGDDGRELTIVSKTAFAHVITIAGGIGAGTNNTVTLGGAIGDQVNLKAIAGKWFLRPSINATASHV
jgi:hypothetical protein